MDQNRHGGITRRAFTSGAAIGVAGASVMANAGTGEGANPATSNPVNPNPVNPNQANPAAMNVLDGLLEEFPIPAISGAVVRDGKLVWAQARGMADLEHQAHASPASLFRLGSVAKVVTAAIGARMAAAGEVDLDAQISTYRPDLPEHHHATTLRQLFNHQGGVRHYTRDDLSPMSEGGSIDTRLYPRTEDALAIFINDPLVAEPGTSSNYSTFGYTLISAVLESASGWDFAGLIDREVAQPLELNELMPEDGFAVLPGRVSFYDPPAMYRAALSAIRLPDGPVVNALPSNAEYKLAGGGMLGSARNVARFGAAQMAGNYLDQSSRDLLFTASTEASERMPALGLGWRIDMHDMLGRRFHHAGNMQGCRAQLVLYPDYELSVAVMSNLGGTPGPILNYADRIAAAFIA